MAGSLEAHRGWGYARPLVTGAQRGGAPGLGLRPAPGHWSQPQPIWFAQSGLPRRAYGAPRINRPPKRRKNRCLQAAGLLSCTLCPPIRCRAASMPRSLFKSIAGGQSPPVRAHPPARGFARCALAPYGRPSMGAALPRKKQSAKVHTRPSPSRIDLAAYAASTLLPSPERLPLALRAWSGPGRFLLAAPPTIAGRRSSGGFRPARSRASFPLARPSRTRNHLAAFAARHPSCPPSTPLRVLGRAAFPERRPPARPLMGPCGMAAAPPRRVHPESPVNNLFITCA